MDKINQTIENGEPRLAAETQLSAELRALPDADKAAAGWILVPETPKPPGPSTDTYSMTITQTPEGPVMSWAQRPKTNEELTREAVARQIDDLNALLGTTGVIDQTTLRGIKATANADINASPAKYIKALADILIALVQAERRASRTIARRFENTQ